MDSNACKRMIHSSLVSFSNVSFSSFVECLNNHGSSLQCLESLNTTGWNRIQLMRQWFQVLEPNTRGMEPDPPRLSMLPTSPPPSLSATIAARKNTPSIICALLVNTKGTIASMDEDHSELETTPAKPNKPVHTLAGTGYNNVYPNTPSLEVLRQAGTGYAKLLEKLDPDTSPHGSCWRSWIQIRQPCIRIRLLWNSFKMLEPDTLFFELNTQPASSLLQSLLPRLVICIHSVVIINNVLAPPLTTVLLFL
ncbi:hypothetical protein LR48_Vigan03g162500 [Vigna angularis]|uniref:Uncharacterized protein n=1 Tax=Phaseolus angularis TaxID=3914 RepID=A0A0L9U5Y5_PHAAN|nr:hypothetical protein LR48_Vigan03g162500 [Vigna angularis]